MGKVFHIPSVIVLVVGLFCVVLFCKTLVVDRIHLNQDREQLDHAHATEFNGTDDGVPVVTPGVAAASNNWTSNSSGDSETVPVPKMAEQGVASVDQDPGEDSRMNEQQGSMQLQESEIHEPQPDDMTSSVQDRTKPVPEKNEQVVSVEGEPGQDPGTPQQEGPEQPQQSGLHEHELHESDQSLLDAMNASSESGTNPPDKTNEQDIASVVEDPGGDLGTVQQQQSELHESQQDDPNVGALEKYLPSFHQFSLKEPFGFEQGSGQQEEYFVKAKKNEQIGWFRATLGSSLPNNVTKNHCWRPKDGEDMLCIPKVFLAGFPKCGTTDAFFMLMKHPQTFVTWKEPHTFRQSKSPEQYASYYRKMAAKMNNHASEYNDMFLIDGSASTIWDWNSDVPTPYILSQYAPNAPAVVMVREPVSRLWSDYRYFDSSPSAKHFHSSVVQSLMALETCIIAENVSHPCLCMTEFHRKYSMLGRLSIGAYTCHLRAWRAVAPNTRVKVVNLIDLFEEELPKTMTSVLEFLGFPLDDDDPIESMSWWPAMRAVPGSEKANTGTQATNLTMLPETEKLLTEFYKPFLVDFTAWFNVTFV